MRSFTAAGMAVSRQITPRNMVDMYITPSLDATSASVSKSACADRGGQREALVSLSHRRCIADADTCIEMFPKQPIGILLVVAQETSTPPYEPSHSYGTPPIRTTSVAG
ncbi:unnamed protein product [Ectocarpus sp. 13 AM-2016]